MVKLSLYSQIQSEKKLLKASIKPRLIQACPNELVQVFSAQKQILISILDLKRSEFFNLLCLLNQFFLKKKAFPAFKPLVQQQNGRFLLDNGTSIYYLSDKVKIYKRQRIIKGNVQQEIFYQKVPQTQRYINLSYQCRCCNFIFHSLIKILLRRGSKRLILIPMETSINN